MVQIPALPPITQRMTLASARMARKNFTESVWLQWTDAAAARNAYGQSTAPEGTWAAAWLLFHETRSSAEQEAR